MKKLMSLVLALAMILSLAACGGKTTGTSPDSAGDSQQETPATSDGAFPEKQITIIMPWSLGGGPEKGTFMSGWDHGRRCEGRGSYGKGRENRCPHE